MANSSIMEERRIIKEFTNDFNKLNEGVNEKIVSTMNRLGVSLAEETNTSTSLKSLDEQVNSLVLANTLKNLVAIKNNMSEKYREFNELTNTNNTMSNKIHNSIKENKQVIDGIYKTIAIINENVKNINETLDKYNSAK